MDAPDHIRVPLRRRDGVIVAYALIDAADEHLTANRWSLDRDGYVARKMWLSDGSCRTLALSREVVGLRHRDGKQADHINGDKLDNRRANLRVATQAQNNQNKPSYRGSTSAHRGVHWDKRSGKWYAKARLNGQAHFLGRYADELEAARAAHAFRVAHMPYANEGRHA